MNTISDRLIVKPLSNEVEKTESNLIVRKNISEQDEIGEVIIKGPEANNVEVGDKVLYPKQASALIMRKGIAHKLVREASILVYFKKDEYDTGG